MNLTSPIEGGLPKPPKKFRGGEESNFRGVSTEGDDFCQPGGSDSDE